MDNFIHSGLDKILEDDKYSLFIVRDEKNVIVAMFVVSNGIVIRDKDEYHELETTGSPYAVFENGSIIDKTCFPTIEIDYLAVQKEYRNQGIGTTIINELSLLARSNNKHFLTVDAFHNEKYSAIPFYEKVQFIPVEDFCEDSDVLRMFLYLG